MSAVILVADDHPSLRALVSMMVRRRDRWQVVEAADGDEALTGCRDQAIDVAILDQRMPGLSGLDVARALRAEDFSGGLILFSAYLDPEVEVEAAELGVRTLAKSDIASLVEVVEQLLPSDASG